MVTIPVYRIWASKSRKSLFDLLLTVAVFSIMVTASFAGLVGQSSPNSKEAVALTAAVKEMTNGGDLGRARPAVLKAVEDTASSDFTDLVAPALGDETIYFGIVSTLEEALQRAKGTDANAIRYNLARIHLLRARRLTLTRDRMDVLANAAQVAAPFAKNDGLRDLAALDLAGDIESEREHGTAAIALYQRMAVLRPDQNATAYSAKAYSAYKVASAQQRIGERTAARQGYETAIRLERAVGNTGYLTHRAYQGIAEIYQSEGNDPAALTALAQSAKVTQDTAHPFTLRLDVARKLLQRGHKREVAAYATTALQIAPDDAAAKLLLDAAK